MKKPKIFLIGIIILWTAVFLIIWGITLFKKSPVKRSAVPEMETRTGIEENARAPETDNEAVSVRCYRVGLIDFKDELPVMGTIKGSLEIGLKSEISGVVEEINFREGDMLYKGDLIAVLNKKDAQLKVDYADSKLETAKVQHEAAKKKYEILKNLYDIGGIIKAKLEEGELETRNAELQVGTAEVELKSAKAELAKTELYAPRDGVLGSRDVEVGEFVTSHDKIGTIYDTSEVFLELGIVEKDIDKIALGQDIVSKVDAYPGMNFTGKVDYVFPLIEGKSRTLTLRARIKNPDAFLLPGMFARASITVAEFHDAMVVPSISLNKTDEGYKIFVADDSGTVSSRIVQVDYVTTDYSVISSGISEGEIVVTDTPQELRDGLPVNVIEVQESGAAE
jgi:membrane fusion protein, multidrug efflux system